MSVLERSGSPAAGDARVDATSPGARHGETPSDQPNDAASPSALYGTTSSDSSSDDAAVPRVLTKWAVSNPAIDRLSARRKRAAMRVAVVAAATAAASATTPGRDADWVAAARGGVPAVRGGVPSASALLAVAPAVAQALATTPAAAAAAASLVTRRTHAATVAAAMAAAHKAVEKLQPAEYDWPRAHGDVGWWVADPLARAYCRSCGVYGCRRHDSAVAAAPSGLIPDPSRMGGGRTDAPPWCEPCRLRSADALAVAEAMANARAVWGSWEEAGLPAAVDLVGTDACRLALLLGPGLCCGVVASIVHRWLRVNGRVNGPAPSPRYADRQPPDADEMPQHTPSQSDDDLSTSRLLPFVPCGHAGACTPERCRCAALNVPCEAACGCGRTRWTWSAPVSGRPPAGLCPRRIFCLCLPIARRAGAVCVAGGNSTSINCPCVKATRECDPDACGGCGAGLALDRHAEQAQLSPPPPGGYSPAAAGTPSLRPCVNLAIQLRLRSPTVLGRSTVAGFGLFAAVPLRANDFVGEYVGEVLDKAGESTRDALYDAVGTSYLFDFAHEAVVDATLVGNKTRMINHKKNAAPLSVGIKSVRGDNRIAFYARVAVLPGKELFFNYGENYDIRLKQQKKDRKALLMAGRGG